MNSRELILLLSMLCTVVFMPIVSFGAHHDLDTIDRARASSHSLPGEQTKSEWEGITQSMEEAISSLENDGTSITMIAARCKKYGWALKSGVSLLAMVVFYALLYDLWSDYYNALFCTSGDQKPLLFDYYNTWMGYILGDEEFKAFSFMVLAVSATYFLVEHTSQWNMPLFNKYSGLRKAETTCVKNLIVQWHKEFDTLPVMMQPVIEKMYQDIKNNARAPYALDKLVGIVNALQSLAIAS